ncbi:IclR family transcriptional regulator [Roseibium sp. SCPC15]|uniref:IclR family transcriptional regulator n=1 Tax=Roseibium sp. SCP15 TaxID=3141376 RepID=UPI00333BF664
MKDKKEEQSGTLQTVSRAVAVLRCFDEGERSLTLAELTARTGLNKVTTFRLAETLFAEGLLNKDARTGIYSISYGLISMARALLDPSGLISRAQPIIQAAREATGETVDINLREGREAVVVSEIHSPQPVRYTLGQGFRADLRVGAAGWAILSQLPEEETENILAASDIRLADGGDLSPELIRSGLEKARAEGFATTEGQRVPDAAGYAAAFRGPNGTVMGSIAIIMPSSRNRKPERKELFAATVRRSADELSNILGSERSVA